MLFLAPFAANSHSIFMEVSVLLCKTVRYFSLVYVGLKSLQ